MEELIEIAEATKEIHGHNDEYMKNLKACKLMVVELTLEQT